MLLKDYIAELEDGIIADIELLDTQMCALIREQNFEGATEIRNLKRKLEDALTRVDKSVNPDVILVSFDKK